MRRCDARDYFLSIPREVEKLAAAEELRARGELDALVPRKSADENPLSARRALAFMSASHATSCPHACPCARTPEAYTDFWSGPRVRP